MANNYIFILGSRPALSAAELAAVMPSVSAQNTAILNFPGPVVILVMETAREINAPVLIKQLGGTIKIGRLIGEDKTGKQPAILAMLSEYLQIKTGDGINKKFNFGFSCYGRNSRPLKTLAMAIKKDLRQIGITSRWVTSRQSVLSSVVVEQNRLLKDGVEIILIETGGKLLIGETLAVQPFKELSFRDYGRPARDDYSGLLPPKLAQIMINLAAAGKPGIILDPFCGSGTILSEALLLGYKNLIGSDLSAKAIADTQKNIEWIKEKFKILNFKVKIFNQDVGRLTDAIKNNSIDAIITEPYLGPQRGRLDTAKTKKELEALYAGALRQFAKILKPDGRIVMVWPVFRESHNAHRVSPALENLKIINPLPAYLRRSLNFGITGRGTLLYGRPGQKVWREIVVLSK